MITGKKMVVLADIKSVLDTETGDRVKAVEHAKKLVSTVELVGVQTAQLGQSQGFNLAYSVIVNGYITAMKSIYTLIIRFMKLKA